VTTSKGLQKLKPTGVSPNNLLFFLLATIIGAAVSFVQRMTHSGPITVDKPGFPHWVRVYDRIGRAISVFPWNLLVLLLLMGLVLRLKFGPRSWPLAFGIGALLGIMVAQLLL